MKTIATCTLAILLTACSMPYKSPIVVAKPGEQATFPGLVDALRKDRLLDLILIHGMCTHDAEWARSAVVSVYSSLGGKSEDVKLEPSLVAGTGITLYQQTLSAHAGELRVNAILWSPLTTPLKRQLCYDQTEKSATCLASGQTSGYEYKRARLNQSLKDTILDDCLVDAMIYQGRSRDEINGQMQKAILQAVATSGASNRSADTVTAAAAAPATVPLAIITESLGSKVGFDAIYKLVTSEQTAAAGTRTLDRITQIFMGANQMPILALADLNLDGTSVRAAQPAAYPQDPIGVLMQMRRQGGPGRLASPLPSVVAFTDPNDLLSYILVPSPHALNAGYSVIDVIVSNDKSYLGLVELPTTAHLGYRTNEAVRSLIACGHPKSAACGQ